LAILGRGVAGQRRPACTQRQVASSSNAARTRSGAARLTVSS